MNWQSITFDWNRVRAFLVTAEEGSLSAAARALKMTQPTLGRQVSALEEELGVTLFERVGRGLRLTENGLALLGHVRAMGEAAERFSRLAAGQTRQIEGQITITASEVIAAYILPEILLALRQAYPGIEVEIIASNATADLHRREADIAIRNHRPKQPDLIARRLPDRQARLYATTEIAEQLVTPEDLNTATFIGFDDTPALMNTLNDRSLTLTPANFRLTCASQLVQWQLVRAGAGIGIMDEGIGDAEPGIARVYPEMAPVPVPMWLTAHRELSTSLRLRTVFDFLASQLSARPPQTP